MREILDYLFKYGKADNDSVKMFIKETAVPSKTTLLLQGDEAEYIYFIKQGSLRLWFNNDGNDVTVQFFFENQMVSSFESIYRNQPSILSIETIEDSILYVVTKKDFQELIDRHPELNKFLMDLISTRFVHYLNLFLSRISKTPEERYLELLKENKKILDRVHHHYIASYLGITPVSLSRIRKRVSTD